MCGLMAGRGRVALATRSGIRPLASGHDLRVDMHRKAVKSPHAAAVISSRRPHGGTFHFAGAVTERSRSRLRLRLRVRTVARDVGPRRRCRAIPGLFAILELSWAAANFYHFTANVASNFYCPRAAPNFTVLTLWIR